MEEQERAALVVSAALLVSLAIMAGALLKHGIYSP
jgi:hypothetical protein